MRQVDEFPWFDSLEQRRLLSQTPLLAVQADLSLPAAIVPAKKKSKAPEITVLLNGTSLADGAAVVDFGNIVVGDNAPTRTFVIRNDGGGPLKIADLQLPVGFSLVDAPAGGIDKGDSTSFTVRMDSSVIVTRSGEISFKTNDADEKTFNFTLRGTVTGSPAPELTVLAGGTSIATNGAIDFGSTALGGGGVTRTLTLRNDGAAPLTVNHFRLPAGFSLVGAPAPSLGPHDTETLTIRLDAASLGSKTGALVFRSNDADERVFVLGLRGTVTSGPGTPPPVQPPTMTGPLATVWLPRLSRSAVRVTDGMLTPIGFPKATVLGRATTRTFLVANEGTSDLKLGAVQLPAGFRLVEGLSTTIAPGRTDSFTVALDTAVAAVRQGQISFTTNDSRASVFNFSIEGTVAPPPLPAGQTGSTLVVNGTAGDDTIIVSGKSSAIVVTINGRSMAGSPFAGVAKIIVNAGDGDDRVDLSRLFLNATANGGFGNDTLIGTAGDDVLNGEAGNDSLDGGPGNDNLLGGDGNDTLTGGAGVDVFHGEAGVDVLDAVDGIADAVLDTGGGTDVLHRDRVDPAAA